MYKVEPPLPTILTIHDYVVELNKLYKNYNEARDVEIKNEILHTIKNINKKIDLMSTVSTIPNNVKGGTMYDKSKN